MTLCICFLVLGAINASLFGGWPKNFATEKFVMGTQCSNLNQRSHHSIGAN